MRDSPAAFDRYQVEITNAIGSSRALSNAEQKNVVKALEIKTLVAPKGLSYANLARESPLGANAENYLGLINDQYPDGEPVAGQVIKIIK